MARGFDRRQLIALFIHGAFERLCQRGLVSGEPAITPKGIAWYDQLRASGFKPTMEEVEGAIRELGLAEVESQTRALTWLILHESGHED